LSSNENVFMEYPGQRQARDHAKPSPHACGAAPVYPNRLNLCRLRSPPAPFRLASSRPCEAAGRVLHFAAVWGRRRTVEQAKEASMECTDARESGEFLLIARRNNS